MSTSNYPEHNYWIAKCYRAIQATLGQQLRDQYEVPKELPHQLLAILVQLTEHPARERANQESPWQDQPSRAKKSARGVESPGTVPVP
jgi:hypothetical protein